MRKALAAIATVADSQRRRDLVTATATLAGLYLTADTITTLTQEAAMPFILDENTVAGRSIARKHRALGREEGREEGESHERVRNLTAVMKAHFGDDPRIPGLAGQLAALPPADAFKLAMSDTTLDELAAILA